MKSICIIIDSEFVNDGEGVDTSLRDFNKEIDFFVGKNMLRE